MMHRFLIPGLFIVLFPASQAYCQNPDPRPLSEIFQNEPGITGTEEKMKRLLEVAANRQTTADNPPLYNSLTEKNNDRQTFVGCFTPKTNKTKSAIFSDDGVDVFINLKRVHKELLEPQHLPSLNESLHLINFKFDKERSYSIRVEYSNIIFNKTGDIDGVTLFAYDGGGSVFGIFLSVDGDKEIDDMVGKGDGEVRDGVGNYLPGQAGSIKKLIKNKQKTDFNETKFEPQQMKLIAEFPKTVVIDQVTFRILISAFDGYCSNKTDDKIKKKGFRFDFSFDKKKDQTSSLPAQVKIAKNRASIDLFCKDYGGNCVATASFMKEGKVISVCSLVIPVDRDFDEIADIYEKRQIKAWNKQYGLKGVDKVKEDDLTFFVNVEKNEKANDDKSDKELEDPDGTDETEGIHQIAQASEGDAHTPFEEYRGYILDGGGFDFEGKKEHQGGHLRLSFARKEFLWEVDRIKEININKLPVDGSSLSDLMDGASKIWSNESLSPPAPRAQPNQHKGVGIFMYYLFDDLELDLTEENFDTPGELRDQLGETRNELTLDGKRPFETDFHHILFIDTGVIKALPPTSGVVTNVLFPERKKRGTIVAISERVGLFGFPKKAESVMAAIAHEGLHFLFEKDFGDFDINNHLLDADVMGGVSDDDKSALMYTDPFQLNRELETVRVFNQVKKLIDIKNSRGLKP